VPHDLCGTWLIIITTSLYDACGDHHFIVSMSFFFFFFFIFYLFFSVSFCLTPRARHYAVIPFSDTAGLIQWVEHTTPLFAVYRQWRQSVMFDANATPTQPNSSIPSSNNNAIASSVALSVPSAPVHASSLLPQSRHGASSTKAKGQNKIPSPIELYVSICFIVCFRFGV
jgi:hypothetical protein